MAPTTTIVAIVLLGCAFGPAVSSGWVTSIAAVPTPSWTTGSPHLELSRSSGEATRVSWSTGTRTRGDVTVSVDRSPEILFARGPSGSQAAPWIVPDHSYGFRLYTGAGAHGRLLASVNVGADALSDGVPVPSGRPLVTSQFVDRLLQLVPFAAAAAFAMLTVSYIRDGRRRE